VALQVTHFFWKGHRPRFSRIKTQGYTLQQAKQKSVRASNPQKSRNFTKRMGVVSRITL
jgi:hypothetical protein